MLVLAVAILATMQVLGVTLVAATLVIPADGRPDAHRLVQPHAVARHRHRRASTGFVGMNLSYHLDVQSGPTIVLVGATLFAVVFAASSTRRWQTPSV